VLVDIIIVELRVPRRPLYNIHAVERWIYGAVDDDDDDDDDDGGVVAIGGDQTEITIWKI